MSSSERPAVDASAPRAVTAGHGRLATAIAAIACAATIAGFARRAKVRAEEETGRATESVEAQEKRSLAPPKLHRITSDGLFKRDPVWVSGDSGPTLVYSVQEDSVRLTLVEYSPSAGETTRLHPKATLPEFRPSFSRDGSVYAFLQSRGNQNLTLAIRRRVADTEAHIHSMARNPVITPDGTRVLVSHPADGGQQISSFDLEGKDERRITSGPHFANWPAVSPDGKRVAYVSDRSGDLEIWTVDLEGGEPRQLTESPRRDIRPAWSPDGSEIAFASARDGNLEIYVVRADRSDLRRLTSNPESDDYPAWHPDGDRIVFVSERAGRFDLYEVPVPHERNSASSERAASAITAPEKDPTPP